MNAKQRIMSFLDKQGFYIVLGLCLVVISITAVLSLTKQSKDDVAQKETATQEDGLQANYGGENMVLEDVTTEQPQTTTEQKKQQISISRPTEGDVIMEFAMDKLLFNSTLKQWTTHKGIDIAANEDAAVKAVLAGTVESVNEDALMGQTIVIAHEGGYKSVYSNLKKEVSVAKGDKVEKDKEIGKVGKTALSEFDMASHLHFEFLVNDKSVNPMEFMSGIKVKED